MKQFSVIVATVVTVICFVSVGAAQKTGKAGPPPDQAKMSFELLSGGKPYVDIWSVRNPLLREKLIAFGRANRIRNAKLTLDDFRKFAAGFNKQQSPPAKTAKKDQKTDPSKNWSDEIWRTFMTMSKGKKHLEIDSVKWKMLREKMHQFAKSQKITDGRLSVDQFRKLAEWQKKQQERERAIRNWHRGPPEAIVFGHGPAAKPVQNSKKTPKEPPPWFSALDAAPKDGQVSLSEWRKGKKDLSGFRHWDANDDGLITPKEALSVLAAEPQSQSAPVKKSNNQELMRQFAMMDGRIALSEYKMVTNRQRKQSGGDRSPPSAVVIDKGTEAKPVYNLTNLPKDLPQWFFKFDAQPKDGQVSLFEWRKGNKDLKEFPQWDPNDDGLITPNEVLRKLVAVPEGNSGVLPFEGALSRTDPLDRLRRGCHHRVHTVYMRAGHNYQIDLASGFDPYLRLEDAQGKNLAQDDDGGPGLHARINFRPRNTGVYRIIATSCSGGRTGAYKLTVTY